MRTALSVALSSLLWLVGSPAFAEDGEASAEEEEYVPPPKGRIWYSNATYMRVNPLGLINSHRVGLRRRISKKSGILFNDTHALIGASALVTPAWARVGGYAEVQPLTIIKAFAEVNHVSYFGTFDQILTWQDQGAEYDDASIAARGDAGEASGQRGWTMTFGGTLRAKVGPIAVRNTAQVTSIDLALDQEGLYFYDQFFDRLAPDAGWMVWNDLDVLYMNDNLRLGVRHTFTDTLDGNGADTDGAMSHHRVGPLFAWQFRDDGPGTKFNQPTVFVLAQWWARHPYRTGAKQPAGLPLIAVGFAFNGDYKTTVD